jgi:hypothetical protein
MAKKTKFQREKTSSDLRQSQFLTFAEKRAATDPLMIVHRLVCARHHSWDRSFNGIVNNDAQPTSPFCLS